MVLPTQILIGRCDTLELKVLAVIGQVCCQSQGRHDVEGEETVVTGEVSMISQQRDRIQSVGYR